MTRRLLLLLLLILTKSPLFSQNDEKGNLIGNPTDNERSSNIVADLSGNTYVGGMFNKQALIVKQNAVDQTLWSKTLNFPVNSTDSVTLAFLDLAGDTVFGCGKIHQFGQTRGAFYFKMNAQTGVLYWSKFETTSTGYFSCMRYANGKFFLIGGIRQNSINASFSGKVIAVSSQNGNMLWETPLLQYEIPFSTGSVGTNRTELTDATDIVNGKFYITGSCTGQLMGSTFWTSFPLVIGITETGTIFMEKFVSLAYQLFGYNDLNVGARIRLDSDLNIVVASHNTTGGYSPTGNLNVFKCDTLGILLFCKYYNIDNNAIAFIQGFNETSDSYVLFGPNAGSFTGSYILKLDKNGVVQRCVGISKPNVEHVNLTDLLDDVIGNSIFLNGQHYFVATEVPIGGVESDINKIIVDEQLNTIDDCSDIFDLGVPEMPTQIPFSWLSVLHFPHTMTFQNGGVLANLPVYTYCDAISLDLVQNPGCGQSTIQATSAGFIDPTFHWSNGTVSSASSITVSTTDTVFVRVLDTKCCELVDTIIPVFENTPPDVQLSNIDTCIQNGGTIVLTPILVNTGSVLWSDGTSGNQLPVFNSGAYTVYGFNSCGSDSATCSVTINYFPELNLPAYLDTCFEIGIGFSYTAPGSSGSYQWSSGSQNATEWISQEGMYSVTLTNGCGSTTDSVQVRRLTDVDLYFPEDSIRDCRRQLPVSLLHLETNYTLELFDPNGNPVGTHLSKTGWYHIRAFNKCSETWDSIYVDLQNELFFYLPNSFTPNGDETNDRFEFKGENMVIRTVRIFNRWGEEIFTQEGKFNGWDGSFRGQICPDGIYAVHLVYEDCFGLPTEFKGHVNLIR